MMNRGEKVSENSIAARRSQWLRDKVWLFAHGDMRQRWRVLRGRCIYCGRADCID